MKSIFTLSLLFVLSNLNAQSIKGQLQDAEGAAIEFANVVLYSAVDSSMVKVETSNENGIFQMKGIDASDYFLKVSYVGYADLEKTNISLSPDQQLDLGVLSFQPSGVDLSEATVTASRVMVEVKPDRTIFNVTGTINSSGSDAISLLRKAPGVTVDNNDNISVLGRAGVLLYVDGKRLPLSGQELTNYLQGLQADQIDRFEIITSPGARYEAEGNAGIIDIRLKKDKNLGTNGTVSTSFSQGRKHRYNLNGSGNYRNKFMNTYGSLGFGDGASYNEMAFQSTQNGLFLDETNYIQRNWRNYNLRLGTDFFINDKHTLGFLVSGNYNDGDNTSDNRITISAVDLPFDILNDTPPDIDSILVANNSAETMGMQYTANINYRIDNKKGRTFNIDLDYGRYQNESDRFQPNRYYNATEQVLLSEGINFFDTSTDIDIYTFKIDYEDDLWGGKLGTGAKLSRVVSDNSFLHFDEINNARIQNDTFSNIFEYNENVYAAYLSYSRPLGKKWSAYAGLRTEVTDATGDLQAFLPSLAEPPVELNYVSWFPSAGITWSPARQHTLALSYGRRINRPDYNVLNPFNNRLSEISFEKGNPNLQPEIVNNLELGYTLNYRYNFKLGYSVTDNQITRFIGPESVADSLADKRANFISWDNLAKQTIYSASASLPVQITKKWSAYFNLSATYQDNQNEGDSEGNNVIDLQTFNYSIYQQHTFDLPAGFKGEISGYFSGPGIWGGVFEYDTSWSLDLGLQRKFFQDRLNVRVNVSDLFYETGWTGVSRYNGLESYGQGNWDSRRVNISLSYNFGNQNVKSRKRKTGMEDEAGRVGGE